MKTSTIVKIAFYVIVTIMVSWICISWFDVISNNMYPTDDGPQLPWNFFKIMFG